MSDLEASDEFYAIAQYCAGKIAMMASASPNGALPDRVRLGVPSSLLNAWLQRASLSQPPPIVVEIARGADRLEIIVDLELEEERSMVARMRDLLPERSRPPEEPEIVKIAAKIEPD